MQILPGIIYTFKSYKTLADKALEQLQPAEWQYVPNEQSNSIAIIVQHMHGNMMSRWTDFLTTDGEKPWRERDKEFEDQGYNSDELQKLWNEGWQTLFDTLSILTEEDLNKTITIRSQPLNVFDALLRQVVHYCSHVGQIIYVAKLIKNADWQTLSIAKNASNNFNESMTAKYNNAKQ